MKTAPTIELDRISKRFGSMVANDSITCRIEAGSIHAFLGENGAGKTTLMRALSGECRPDSGQICFDGSPIEFQSSAQARRMGVGMVYQHFTLVPSMTIMDNILLGDPSVPFIVRKAAIVDRVKEAFERYEFSFELMSPVWKLSMADRQKLEIFKLLWRDARTLVLDEPTSQLAPFESEEVLQLVHELSQAGRTVLLVTHNIGEVLRFASWISVLRRGRCIATLEAKYTSFNELARLMVGELVTSRRSLPSSRRMSHPLLRMSDVQARSDDDGYRLSIPLLDLHGGEILGSAGIAGSGRDELAAVLAGQMDVTEGRLELDGRVSSWATLRNPLRRCAHVPADPRARGSVASLSLLDNLFLGDNSDRGLGRGHFLRRKTMHQEALRRLEAFHVSCRNLAMPCGALSGGNLQRLVLARETSIPAPVFLAVNPTVGLDIAGIARVHDALRECARNGRAIVLVSPDLQELLDICDRIAVFSRGELIGVEATESTTIERLGLLMGGVSSDIVDILLGSTEPGTSHAHYAARQSLRRLLTSSQSWHRLLAAQLGIRFFDESDGDHIEERLAQEKNEDIRAWYVTCLLRMGRPMSPEEQDRHFRRSPSSYVEIQQTLHTVPDSRGLVPVLEDRARRASRAWDRVLVSITLEHIQHYTSEMGCEHQSATTANRGESDG